jgi:signal transduction histidine kinase
MLWRFLALVLLATLGAGWTLSARGDPQTQAVAPAVHVTQVQLAVLPSQGYTAPPVQLAPGAVAGPWIAVALPHPVHKQSHAPDAQLVTAWYRAEVRIPTSAQPTYLYMPRWQAIGHIAVYADGRLVYAPRSSAKWNGFNLPVWAEVAGPSNPPPHEILIRIEAQKNEGVNVSTFWVGPRDALATRYAIRHFVQVGAPEWGCAIFMLIGLITFGLWLRRRQEPAYVLIFAVALLATAHSLEYFIGAQPIPVSDNWFQWMESNCEIWYNILVFVMVTFYIGSARKWMRRLALGYALLFTAWTTAMVLMSVNLEGYLSLMWAVSISANLAVVAAAWFGYFAAPTRLGLLFCALNSFVIPAALIDIAMSGFNLSGEGVYVIPYVPALQAALFLYIMIDRHLAALSDAERARADLTLRLDEREAELAVTYDKLRESEQQQMLARERQRLMRDMHDGVGSSLMGALVVVERGEADAQQTAEMLRHCLDDLKLAIDSLEPVDSDLLLLLATARYRLEPRFEQVGVKLAWSVGELPPLPMITPEHALHILRIVQEIFTNIVKHAQAREVRLSVGEQNGEVVIDVVDDGVGFDATAVTAPADGSRRGRGLANLAARAAAIGATIVWTSTPGRTCVELRMPLAAA